MSITNSYGLVIRAGEEYFYREELCMVVTLRGEYAVLDFGDEVHVDQLSR